MTFSLPDESRADQTEVYVQGKFGPQVARIICRSLNHAQGHLIKGETSEIGRGTPAFHLKPAKATPIAVPW